MLTLRKKNSVNVVLVNDQHPHGDERRELRRGPFRRVAVVNRLGPNPMPGMEPQMCLLGVDADGRSRVVASYHYVLVLGEERRPHRWLATTGGEGSHHVPFTRWHTEPALRVNAALRRALVSSAIYMLWITGACWLVLGLVIGLAADSEFHQILATMGAFLLYLALIGTSHRREKELETQSN